MNTVQLECFLAVVNFLNFSKAAETLKITQPAVSHQINSLEDELDTKLFSRTSKSVALTPSGIQFIEDANNILKIAFSAKSRLSENAASNLIFFRIGAHTQLEVMILPPVLRKLVKDFPMVHPDIKYLPFQSLENLLVDDTIQVMLGYKYKQKKQTTNIYQELIKCPIVCVCSKEHPLASHRLLTKENLIGNMILNDPHRIPSELLHYQNQLSANRKVAELYLSDGYESSIALTRAVLGFSLAMDFQKVQEPDLCYIPIVGAPVLSFGLYYKSLKGDKILKQFIAYCKELFQSLQ